MGLRTLAQRLWHSPTLNTWVNQGTRALSLVAVIPLLVTHLTKEEVALWYLFSSAGLMAIMLDTAVTPTLQRFIAYGMGGLASVAEILTVGKIRREKAEPNWEMVERAFWTVTALNFWLTIIGTALFAVFGTVGLLRPVAELDNAPSIWAAWAIFVVAQMVAFFARRNSSLIIGTNHVALANRVDALFNLVRIGGLCLVILLGGRLLALATFSLAVNVLNNFQLHLIRCSILGGRFRRLPRRPLDKELFAYAWKPCLQTFIMTFSSQGTLQASGFIYANMGNSAGLASYLLALRFLSAATAFSQTPFNARVPHFIRTFTAGDLDSLRGQCGRAMQSSLGLFTLFAIVGAIGMPWGLTLIGSNVPSLSPELWLVLCMGKSYERWNAINGAIIQWTNEMYMYWAVPVYGAIYLGLQIALGGWLGLAGLIWAYPVAMILVYQGWVHRKASRVLAVSSGFQLRYGAPATAVLLLATAIAYGLTFP